MTKCLGFNADQMSAMLRSLRRVWLGSRGLDASLRRLKPSPGVLSSSKTLEEAKTAASLTNEQRLGDVVWKPEQEFPGRSVIDRHAMTLDRELQILRRIARVSLHSIAQPARLALLGTRAPELVAQALDLDPRQMLRVFHPATSSADAALQLRIMSVFTARAMLAGFMVVTQLLNIVRASGKAALGYSEIHFVH
eukprot:jgi/Phyca11/16455/fgenesh1_pg.PHYCAscaffold_20_\